MEMYQLKARCSGLADLMVKPKSGNGISATAKSAVRKIVKFDLFGYQDFEGNKYTEKGIALEEQAIKLSGRKRGLPLKKNTERRENDWITGECDIYVPSRKLIIDTKCPWDIGSHPFLAFSSASSAKKARYDIQMQGYMWLWDCDEAQIDFVLLPTPYDQLSSYDDPNRYIDLVEQIPQEKRITTVTIKRDEKIIEKIKERVEIAQEYYQQLIQEMS